MKIEFSCQHISNGCICFCRNNLTIIDAIVIKGQGGRGEMKLSNKKPGSAIPLQFDITEKHLKNCDSKSIKTLSLSLRKKKCIVKTF